MATTSEESRNSQEMLVRSSLKGSKLRNLYKSPCSVLDIIDSKGNSYANHYNSK